MGPRSLLALTLAVGALCAAAEDASPPQLQPLPQAFSMVVNVTAHRLEDGLDYPHKHRQLRVWYDRAARRARVDAFPARRTSLRRVDEGVEYQVTRLDGGEALCKESRLKGDATKGLPAVEWPVGSAAYVGEERVNGQDCELWRDDLGPVAVDVFISKLTGNPVRVAVETVEQTEPVRLTVPDITFDVDVFKPNVPKAHRFALQADAATCVRQPNDIGFPSVHVLHYYLRV